MARFAISAFLLALAAAQGVNGFTAQSQAPAFAKSTTLSAAAEDGEREAGSMTAREARVVAPATAALAAVPLLGSSAANAADAAFGAGSFQSSVAEYFPGAFPSSQISKRVLTSLKNRGHSLDNTLFGASICSDEINSVPNSVCAQLQKGLTDSKGGLFNLGGLAGLPFVGKSGFGAFFSHCPVDGKVVIVFGPHVGISQEGVVGKVERVGMTKPSTACGAGIGAYKALLQARKDGVDPPSDWTMDKQEEWILNELKGKLHDDEYGSGIGAGFMGNGKMATVTYRTYDLVWDLMKSGLDISVTNPAFWEKVTEVTLLGGIVINQGGYSGAKKAVVEDYFQPFVFQSWRAQEADNALVKEDLFKSTFQMKNPKIELGL
eukprot:CAMPEP_0183295252 /NCGR_PEP_ID=MMETSP0160_2-20130417/3276_1 /TAXON_ID=2839 ORGANISM="Odontella Sinensis, Strain Grunow 1884" /NCGR_SAMPLE_ID=MMETSP0160_2 /ASSEMBLY_ACC=CAM_ASM_000250 /LENGTH=376 /DNA_ID=CAMNT_0025456707 /DNA_START=57 /DNA_END=1187 /DNA_ORIENTATION=+